MNDLIPNVGAGALLERTLLADDRAVRIGAIQTLDYSRAVVITHDKWKEAVGGIPQYAFLLATARETAAAETTTRSCCSGWKAPPRSPWNGTFRRSAKNRCGTHCPEGRTLPRR